MRSRFGVDIGLVDWYTGVTKPDAASYKCCASQQTAVSFCPSSPREVSISPESEISQHPIYTV